MRPLLVLHETVIITPPGDGDVRTRERIEPFQKLAAHYPLTGLRVVPL